MQQKRKQWIREVPIVRQPHTQDSEITAKFRLRIHKFITAKGKGELCLGERFLEGVSSRPVALV